jgi:hypothetical protein
MADNGCVISIYKEQALFPSFIKYKMLAQAKMVGAGGCFSGSTE